MSRGGRAQENLRALSGEDGGRPQQLICGKYHDRPSRPFALRTRGVICELSRHEFAIQLSIRGVGEYAMRRGHTPQKVARREHERVDTGVKGRLSIDCPKIKPRAQWENAEIIRCDETGVRTDESRHRGYARPG